MGVEQEIGDVGALGHDGIFTHFAYQSQAMLSILRCWGCSIIPNQGIGDCKNMGPNNWPNNYTI
jgi:hypothetical protein